MHHDEATRRRSRALHVVAVRAVVDRRHVRVAAEHDQPRRPPQLRDGAGNLGALVGVRLRAVPLTEFSLVIDGTVLAQNTTGAFSSAARVSSSTSHCRCGGPSIVRGPASLTSRSVRSERVSVTMTRPRPTVNACAMGPIDPAPGTPAGTADSGSG